VPLHVRGGDYVGVGDHVGGGVDVERGPDDNQNGGVVVEDLPEGDRFEIEDLCHCGVRVLGGSRML